MSDPRLSIIPAGAVTDKRLAARDLQILCLFGRHTDRKGWCRRSQVKMAQEIGAARSTVQLSIDRLVEAGWLQRRVLKEPHTRGARDSAHEYRVMLDVPDSPQSEQSRNETGHPADQSAPPPADHGSAPPADLDRHLLTKESLTERESTPQTPLQGGLETSVVFQEVWNAWPFEKRRSPEGVRRAIDRLDPEALGRLHRSIGPALAVYSRRKKARVPALSAYVSTGVFEEFADCPPIDEYGNFRILPETSEFRAWMDHYRRQQPNGKWWREYAEKGRPLFSETRWPPPEPDLPPPTTRADIGA